MASNPLVSVIVPTRNNKSTLRICLETISKQTYEPIELIVVDRDSTDNTKAIAREFTSSVFDHGPERAAQRNYGADRAHGEYLLFIDSDMELSPAIAADCVSLAQAKPDIAAINIPESSFGKGFWAKCKALERSYYVGVDWIEAPRFMATKTFDQAGKWNETLMGAEDYELTHRLRKFGQFGRIKPFIRHNEGHIMLSKLLRKRVYYYGEGFQGKGQSNHYNDLPRFIALFFSRPPTIFRHPVLWGGMMFMRFTELTARIVGYANAKTRRSPSIERN